MTWIERLKEALDTSPRISRRRAHEAWMRQEMDRHPHERAELWRGLEEGHEEIGTRLRRGDIAKRPVFGRGAI